MSEEKDFRYYENKIGELLEERYRIIAKQMMAAGEPREKIVEAIMLANAADVHEARHIGEDPTTN